MIKPDGVQASASGRRSHVLPPFASTFVLNLAAAALFSQRGLVGEIIQRFERRGYQLRAMKIKTVERSLAEAHYADLSSKPFFKDLVDYIISGPVVCMVWCVWCRLDQSEQSV